MNSHNYRSTSFKHFFGQNKPSSNISMPYTIPRESSSTFYPSRSHSAPKMKGWLKRFGGGIMKSWQSRWVVLQGDTLLYHSSEDESKSLVGKIYLPGHSVIEHPYSEQRKFAFEIIIDADRPDRRASHHFCADSEEERKEWLKNLKQVLYGSKGGAIFGRPLELTLAYETKKDKNRKVPELVQMCVEFLQANGLEMEGIFRLPGRTALVKQLRNAFDIGERPSIELTNADVHTVASLLKMYLRDLPGPLIPISFYDSVMHIITRELNLYPDESVDKLAKIISTLPLANYNLLHYLCSFLHKVGQRSEVNRMTEMNLATVFSQSFIEPEDDDPALLMGTADNRSKAAFILISKFDRIFVRNIPEAEQDSPKSNLLECPLSFHSDHFVQSGINGDVGAEQNMPANGGCSGLPSDNAPEEFDPDCASWTIVDNSYSQECDEDMAARYTVDRVAQRGHIRRSASLGDDSLLTGGDFVNPRTSVSSGNDLSSEVELLLVSDPMQLSHEELVSHFLQLREVLREQCVANAKLNDELNRCKQRNVRKLRTMAERLHEERTATSEAVTRIVQVQADLERHQPVAHRNKAIIRSTSSSVLYTKRQPVVDEQFERGNRGAEILQYPVLV